MNFGGGTELCPPQTFSETFPHLQNEAKGARLTGEGGQSQVADVCFLLCCNFILLERKW